MTPLPIGATTDALQPRLRPKLLPVVGVSPDGSIHGAQSGLDPRHTLMQANDERALIPAPAAKADVPPFKGASPRLATFVCCSVAHGQAQLIRIPAGDLDAGCFPSDHFEGRSQQGSD
jgi:hypothetical protein